MKCANCGNTNTKSLFMEDDTFYCSKCTHRTLIATGKDDLIICPVCKRLRDRKGMYCWWCNDSLDSGQKLSKKEYEDLDTSLKIFEERVDKKNLRYYKIKGRKSL